MLSPSVNFSFTQTVFFIYTVIMEVCSMNYKKTTGTFLSSNGMNSIAYYVYEPIGEIKGMMQISHGMCEYIERYEPHIDHFTKEGYLVFGNDHLGHKGSVSAKADLGYMGSKGGWKHMVDDVHTLSMMMKEAHPDLKLCLFGHSMGSFIARAVLGKYGSDYDRAIICGTGGTNKMAGMGLKMIHVVRKLQGERTRSKFLTNTSFGSYNNKYENVRTPYDWLTRDEKVVDAYMVDEYCMFTFTAAAYEDLISVLRHVSTDAWYDSIPKSLPLLVISGDMDPVGGWGEGVKEVDQRLRQRSLNDYTMILYPGMRHEILNEVGREKVYEDIVSFLNKMV